MAVASGKEGCGARMRESEGTASRSGELGFRNPESMEDEEASRGQWSGLDPVRTWRRHET